MSSTESRNLPPDADRSFDVDPTAPGALAPMDAQASAARDAVEAKAQAEADAWLQRIAREEALQSDTNAAVPAPAAPFAPKAGKERWPVKTLNDEDRGNVPIDPSAITVSTVREMWKVERPQDMPLTYPVAKYQSNRAVGPETTVWQIEGRIIAYKWEKDGDFHIVLQDLQSGYTMIVETPQTGTGSDGVAFVGDDCPDALRTRMEAARVALEQKLDPTPSFQSTSLKVRVTGVGFFDILHGQNGVARTNAIELHPILDIQFLE